MEITQVRHLSFKKSNTLRAASTYCIRRLYHIAKKLKFEKKPFKNTLMKYSVSIEIDKPIDEVISLFNNADNLKLWMEGLQSFEPLSGRPGEVGAKSRLKFKMGKRKIEMIETITVKNLPEEFTANYEAKGVFNTVKNSFEQLPNNKTKYATEQKFQFKGFMKLMGLLMPGAFKKQSMKYLQDFKSFAERQ